MGYTEEIKQQVAEHFDTAKRERDQARHRERESQVNMEEIARVMESLGMEVPDMTESFPVGDDHEYRIANGEHPAQ